MGATVLPVAIRGSAAVLPRRPAGGGQARWKSTAWNRSARGKRSSSLRGTIRDRAEAAALYELGARRPERTGVPSPDRPAHFGRRHSVAQRRSPAEAQTEPEATGSEVGRADPPAGSTVTARVLAWSARRNSVTPGCDPIRPAEMARPDTIDQSW